ncbi:MAG: Crp/Fnr family transcriptional regulator [Alphaproteobacteria bacterium]
MSRQPTGMPSGAAGAPPGPLFPVLTEAEAALISYVDLPPRAMVVAQGAAAQTVRCLRAGWAFSFRTMADGRRQIVSLLLPGDTLGPEALIGLPVSCGIQAITAVTIGAYPLAEMARLMHGNAAVRDHLLRVLVESLREREERIVALGARSALRSVAALMLDLHRRMLVLNLAGPDGFDCPLTQEMLADALGITKVHVSRTLGALRRDGVLDLHGGRLTLHDPATLRRLAGMAA